MKTKFRSSWLILTLVVFAIFSTMPAATAWAEADYSIIRVKLSASGTSVPIQVNGTYLITQNQKEITGAYTLSVSGGNVHISGSGIDADIGSTLTISRNGNTDRSNTIKIGSYNYLGDMVVSVVDNSIRIVNHVPTEEYLYGVVGYEMSDYFPVEALKAQAVCARGYGIRSITGSGTYDIGDTSSDQVYRGYNPAYTNVIAAVDGTCGEVLTYDGTIISTYYSASNGGQTELPGNAWGGGDAKNAAYPYLAQHDDIYDVENPSSIRQEIFVPSTVTGSAYDCISVSGDYVAIIVCCSSFCNVRSGPGTSYSIVGTAPVNSAYTWVSVTDSGWHEVIYDGSHAYIHGDYVQKIDNGRFLYANAVLNDCQTKAFAALTDGGASIDCEKDVRIDTVSAFANGLERWPDTGSRCFVTANATIGVQYYPAGSDTLTETQNVDITINLMNQIDGSYTNAHEYLNSSLRMRGVSAADGGFIISNARYGHGVGMSQRGAQTMAATYAKGYDEILSFYFPGTTLTAVNTQVVPTPVLSSSQYTVGGDRITGLSLKLEAGTLLSNLSVQNGSVALVDASGNAKTGGVVVTGDVVQLKDNNGNVVHEYTIVIYGDVSCDGDITVLDLLKVQRHLLDLSSLQGAAATAANVSRDGGITVLDLLKVQRHLLELKRISQ